MNGQYFNDRVINPESVEKTDQEMNNPVVNTDPYNDMVTVDATSIEETPIQAIPMGSGVTAVAPVDEMVVPEVPMGETRSHEESSAPVVVTPAPLLSREDSERFRTHWNEIQGKFVDEPRAAVEQADALVAEVIGQITKMFADEHSALENQWNQGNDVSTEDLRMALQRYRSFFNRLVV
jgi:hypothetical protein